MSIEHDELMEELLKNRDIRALARDIKRSDVEDTRRELIEKACNPEGEPEVLYDRLLRAYLKEDDRFAGMTPWYASDEQVIEQRDELNTDRVENEAFDDGNNETNDRPRNSGNSEHGEGAAALPVQQNPRANDAHENGGGVATHARTGNMLPVVTAPIATSSTTTTTGMTTSVATGRLHGAGGPRPSSWAHQPPPQAGFDYFREREFTGLRFRQPIRIISQQRVTMPWTQAPERHGLEPRERGTLPINYRIKATVGNRDTDDEGWAQTSHRMKGAAGSHPTDTQHVQSIKRQDYCCREVRRLRDAPRRKERDRS